MPIQFLVSEGATAVSDGEGLRRAPRLFRKQLVDTTGRRVSARVRFHSSIARRFPASVSNDSREMRVVGACVICLSAASKCRHKRAIVSGPKRSVLYFRQP